MQRMTTEERERLAYAEGFTEAAGVLAALSDAENLVEAFTDTEFDLKAELSDTEQSLSTTQDDLMDSQTDLDDMKKELAEAEIDRDTYLQALQDILDGVNAGTLTAGGCMMIAAQALP